MSGLLRGNHFAFIVLQVTDGETLLQDQYLDRLHPKASSVPESGLYNESCILSRDIEIV